MGPIILSPVDDETVIREWLKPTAAHYAPAPKQRPITLPESWTVVTTATRVVNGWTGDVPLVADGNYSCDLSQIIRLTARTPSFTLTR